MELRRLFDQGASLKVSDAEENTVIHWAAGHADLAGVMLPLKRGVEVDVLGDDDSTPLLWASMRGVVEALLSAGANVEAADYRVPRRASAI